MTKPVQLELVNGVDAEPRMDANGIAAIGEALDLTAQQISRAVALAADEPDTTDLDLDSDDDVVLREQPETAVYTNPSGGIVIRQRSIVSADDDPFVFIRPENLPLLIAALKKRLPR